MREYIDENDKKNEIRLLFKHPSYKDKFIIVVEGYSDVRLFRSLLNHENVKLETIDGKKNLISAMRDLVGEFPNKIMAICDADCDHLMASASARAQYSIFVTDHHDAEIMMLKSPALNSYIHEYASIDNADEIEKNLLDAVLSAAYPLGLLRWINTEENLTLKFRGLNFNKFIHVNNLSVTLNVSTLIDDLLSRSGNKAVFATKEYLLNSLEEYRKRDSCKFQVACGHDMTNIIAIVFRQRWASIELNMDHEKVESALRIGYQIEYFKATDLHKKIVKFFCGSGVQFE